MEKLNILVNPISEQKREKYLIHIYPKKMCRDFSGWLPSNAGGTGSIPGWRAKIPYASQPKKKHRIQNKNNIVTNSIKIFKMVHIKKKSFKNMQMDNSHMNKCSA